MGSGPGAAWVRAIDCGSAIAVTHSRGNVALEDGVDVARVEVDDPGCINPYYEGVPELGPSVWKFSTSRWPSGLGAVASAEKWW